MSCSEANDRMKMRTHVVMRGEAQHPVHEHMRLSGADGIETGKRIYRNFYGRNQP